MTAGLRRIAVAKSLHIAAAESRCVAAEGLRCGVGRVRRGALRYNGWC